MANCDFTLNVNQRIFTRLIEYFLNQEKGIAMIENVLENLLAVQTSVSAVDVKLDEIKAKLASFVVEGESVVKIEKSEYDSLVSLVEGLKASTSAVEQEASELIAG